VPDPTLLLMVFSRKQISQGGSVLLSQPSRHYSFDRQALLLGVGLSAVQACSTVWIFALSWWAWNVWSRCVCWDSFIRRRDISDSDGTWLLPDVAVASRLVHDVVIESTSQPISARRLFSLPDCFHNISKYVLEVLLFLIIGSLEVVHLIIVPVQHSGFRFPDFR
jgi:hypothetical protein